MMAYVNMGEIHATLGKSIAYIVQGQKTDGGRLAQTNFQSYAMDHQRAERIMTRDIEACPQGALKGGVLAYHVIQSFRPGEVSADLAHQVGVEFAERITDGGYKYVLATHTDKDHIHNHLIICAASDVTHRKMRVDASKKHPTIKQWWKISDEICTFYHLSCERGLEVESPKFVEGLNGLYASAKGISIKDDIRRRIDMAAGKSTSFEQFTNTLLSSGVKVNVRGKHLTFELTETGFKVRDTKLGQAFDQTNIMAKINRSVVNQITFNHKMIASDTNGNLSVWLPGTRRSERITIPMIRVIKDGQTYRAFLTEDQEQVITDNTGRYKRTVLPEDLYTHFAEPDIDLSGLTEHRLTPRIGVSEAQHRFYVMQGRRLDQLRDRARELNAATKWVAADHDLTQDISRLDAEIRKERAEFQALIISRTDLNQDLDGQRTPDKPVETQQATTRRERKLTELELDLKALKRIESRHRQQTVQEPVHTRKRSR